MLKPSVQIHNMDGILVAEFWDCLRLDPAPVQELRKHYEAHVQKPGRPELVVDLSGVGFAGSAALGNFVALHRLVRQHGGRIVFCNVDPTVSEVFRASKLESLFGFESDRDAALHAIREPPSSESGEKDRPGRNAAPAARCPASRAPPANLGSRPVLIQAGCEPTSARRLTADSRPGGQRFFVAFPLIGVRPATMIAVDGGERHRSRGSRRPPTPGDEPESLSGPGKYTDSSRGAGRWPHLQGFR